MITIYKYQVQIADVQSIKMPRGAKILCIQMQQSEPMLWAEVDTSAQLESRIIRLFGTGNLMLLDDTIKLKYISTFQLSVLVLHVYEQITV